MMNKTLLEPAKTSVSARRCPANIVAGAGLIAWGIGIAVRVAPQGPTASGAHETGRLAVAVLALLLLAPAGGYALQFGLRRIHRGPFRLHPCAWFAAALVFGANGLACVVMPELDLLPTGVAMLLGSAVFGLRGVRALRDARSPAS
jgi:hypothetical protein